MLRTLRSLVPALLLSCGDGAIHLEGPLPPRLPLPSPGHLPGTGFVQTPAGAVNIGNGNLRLERTDLLVHSRLGPLQVGQTYNSATGVWVDWLDLRYDGHRLVDEHGTRLSGGRLRTGRWVRIDDRSLRTRGGWLYRFERDRLIRIESIVGEAPTLTLERDASGRLLAVVQRREDPEREEVLLKVEYDADVVRLQSYGRAVERRLGPAGALVGSRDAAGVEQNGAATLYRYGGGRLREVIDPAGLSVRIFYDELGRVTTVDQNGALHLFRYEVNPSGERFATYHVDPTGAITEFHHDGSGRVTWRRDPEGSIWRSAYQGDVRLWSEDPLGARWSFESLDGVRIARTDPTGERESRELEPGAWNPDGADEPPWRVLRDRLGGVWSREFDSHGRIVGVTDPTGSRIELEYDGVSIRKLSRPEGSETCFHHDAAHGLVTRVDPGCRGPARVVLRTEAGLPVTEVGGGVRIFDASGRVRELLFPWDDPARPARVVFDRDPVGRTVAVENPFGGRIELDRDRAGRVRTRQERVGFELDFEDRIVDATWQSETFQRDAVGRIVARTRPDGSRVELDRDRRGRVIALAYLDALGGETARVTLGRDPAGRIVRIEDSREAGPTEIERDAAGHAHTIRYPRGERIVQHLDPEGRPLRLELYLPGGRLLRSFEWVRDGLGRPVRMYEGDDLLATVTYRPRGHQLRLANGVIQEWEFDGMNRLTFLVLQHEDGRMLQSQELHYWSHRLRPTRRLMQVIERGARVAGLNLIYDAAGRIARWSGLTTHTFEWDVLGNLRLRRLWELRKEQRGAGFGYNLARTQLQKIGPHPVVLDRRGRVTLVEGEPVEWEPFDRPRRLGAAVLRYSTLGAPISRTVDGKTTLFLFGGLVHTDGSLRPTGLELPSFFLDLESGEHEFLHRDFRNNVAWTTGGAGELVASRRFGPFETEEVTGTPRSRRGFAGGEEIGSFVLLGERVYHPRSARFLSPDPIPDWINRYTYAQGDPVNFWDPEGLARRETRTTIEMEIQARPIPRARLRVQVEQLVTDEEEPLAPPGEAPGREQRAPESSGPPPFPETPNTPTVPDLSIPPLMRGCDAIAAAPSRVALLLALLPFLLLAVAGRR